MDTESVSQGRGAAFYFSTAQSIECTYLTIVKNTGNAIVDLNGPTATISFSNFVENHCSDGFGLVYANAGSGILNGCIFQRNQGGNEAFLIDSESQSPFELSECIFDRSPSTRMYTVITNVQMGVVAATQELRQLEIAECPVEPTSSPTGSFTLGPIPLRRGSVWILALGACRFSVPMYWELP
jgi:hypothetical protein